MPKGIPKSGKRAQRKGKGKEPEIPTAEMLTAMMPQRAQQAPKEEQKEEPDRTPLKLGQGYFGPMIPVESQQKIKHRSDYIPDGNLICLIVGVSGAGKSRLLTQIVPQLANVSHMVYLSRITNNPVEKALRRYCETTKAPDYLQSTEKDAKPVYIDFNAGYDEETAQQLIEDMIQIKDERASGLYVSDDFTNFSTSRSDPMNRINITVSSMLRNHGIFQIYITQAYQNLPTLLRTNANCRVFFASKNIHAVRCMRMDWELLTDRPPSDFDELFAMVQRCKYAFLMINSEGKDNRIFINLPKSEECTPDKPTDGPEEVTFQDDDIKPENLKKDERLHNLCELVKQSRGTAETSRSALTRRNIAKAERALEAYIQYLAETTKKEYDEIRDLVYEIHGV